MHSNRIAEYNETTGALIREYVWLQGAPIAVVEGGVISFVRSDHIGRPVFATNASGVKVWTAAYLPFGGGARHGRDAADREVPRAMVPVRNWIASELDASFADAKKISEHQQPLN